MSRSAQLAPASSLAVPSTSSPYLALAVLWAGHFAVDTGTAVWSMHKTLAQVDPVAAGLIATMAGMIGNGGQVLFGLLADRYGRGLLLGLGMLGTAGIGLLPYTDSLAVMALIVAACFLGSAAFHPAATGQAASLLPTRRGLFISVFLSGGYIGFAGSHLLYSHLYTHALTPLLALVPMMALLLLPGLPRAKRAGGQSLARTWAATAGRRGVLTRLYLLGACGAGAHFTVVFALPDLLRSVHAHAWLADGGGHLLLVGGAATGLIPAGLLADRYGPRQILRLGAIGSLIVVLFLGLGMGTGAVLSGCLLFLYGLSTGAVNPVVVTYGNRLLPGSGATVSGLLMGGAWFVGSFAATAAGTILKYSTAPVAPVLGLTAGCWIVAALLGQGLPKLDRTS